MLGWGQISLVPVLESDAGAPQPAGRAAGAELTSWDMLRSNGHFMLFGANGRTEEWRSLKEQQGAKIHHSLLQ